MVVEYDVTADLIRVDSKPALSSEAGGSEIIDFAPVDSVPIKIPLMGRQHGVDSPVIQLDRLVAAGATLQRHKFAGQKIQSRLWILDFEFVPDPPIIFLLKPPKPVVSV